MPKYTRDKAVNRIIDANLNRLKEGLRVCEEVARFKLNNKGLTLKLKETRHSLAGPLKYFISHKYPLLLSRESAKDIGRNIYAKELKRETIEDIFFANIQRAKESARVLEEFSKLISKSLAVKFKEIRYHIYEIEKNAVKRITALRDPR